MSIHQNFYPFPIGSPGAAQCQNLGAVASVFHFSYFSVYVVEIHGTKHSDSDDFEQKS